MLICITAKVMLHDRLGRLTRGRVVDVPDKQATEWLKRGFAELPEVKAARETPSSAAGAPSSASQAAQASPQTTSSESAPGASTKRGRKKTAAA